jgi:tudor domain-containing protein 1/4/6/7
LRFILQEDMTTYAEGLLVGFSPNAGEICMVRLRRPMDSSPYWYRGACLQVVDEDGCKNYFMILVDFGDVVVVDHSDLRRIPKRFVDFCPFVAQQAILKDVQNLDVSDALAQRVAELLPLYSKVECKVVDRDGAAYVIDIPSVSSVLRSEGLI